MGQEQQQQPEEIRHEFAWKAKEGTPQIYTNYVSVSWTLFDVRFTLGQLVPEHPGTKVFLAEERGAVTFAWPEAKALRDMLVSLVEEYEKANGAIPKLKLPGVPETLKNKADQKE